VIKTVLIVNENATEQKQFIIIWRYVESSIMYH